MKKFIIVFVILGIIGVGIYMALKAPATSKPTPAGSGYENYKVEDVDKDGNVSVADRVMIESHIGCSKGSACWDERVGKTIAGDNPIYTSDLDLNGDGTVNQPDVAMVSGT